MPAARKRLARRSLLLDTLAHFDGYARSRSLNQTRHWRICFAGQLRLAWAKAWDGHWAIRQASMTEPKRVAEGWRTTASTRSAQSWAVLAGPILRAENGNDRVGSTCHVQPISGAAGAQRGGADQPIRGTAGLRENGRRTLLTAGRSWHSSARVKGTKAGTLLSCSIKSTMHHAGTDGTLSSGNPTCFVRRYLLRGAACRWRLDLTHKLRRLFIAPDSVCWGVAGCRNAD